MTCPFDVFCIYVVFSICFFAGILLLAWKKAKQMQNKRKNKANQKSKINAKNVKGTSPVFAHVFPFSTFLFFPIYFASGFFSFEVLLFDFPGVFLFFFAFLHV